MISCVLSSPGRCKGWLTSGEARHESPEGVRATKLLLSFTRDGLLTRTRKVPLLRTGGERQREGGGESVWVCVKRIGAAGVFVCLCVYVCVCVCVRCVRYVCVCVCRQRERERAEP